MIRFRLNDATAVLPDEVGETPLVYVLRGPRVGDMTPRVGCGREQCGACRVLVDGAPAYACTLPAHAVDGRRVETAAGLDTAVRSALIEANATQCGFCLPGIVVAAEALFRKDPRPDPGAIARAPGAAVVSVWQPSPRAASVGRARREDIVGRHGPCQERGRCRECPDA